MMLEMYSKSPVLPDLIKYICTCIVVYIIKWEHQVHVDVAALFPLFSWQCRLSKVDWVVNKTLTTSFLYGGEKEISQRIQLDIE